jgi:BirA family biotin operon repressor/biotin-[acetyl-CoA-carboxylase] ligase
MAEYVAGTELNIFGGRNYFTEVTDSTMEDAKTGRHGDVFVASFQNHGRGRLPGRVWEAEQGSSLLGTLVLEPATMPGFQTDALSLRISLAIEKLCRRLGIAEDIALKWPNDVLVREKKLSGILCSSISNKLLIGCGINLKQQQFDLPAISLAILGVNTDFKEILPLYLESLYSVFSQTQWMDEYCEKLYKQGEIITIDLGQGKALSGRVYGIQPDGALILERAGEYLTVYSGEYSGGNP